MSAWRLLPLLGLVPTAIGCAALNYPSEEAAAASSETGAPAAPILYELGSGADAVEYASLETSDASAPRTWYALSREARLARQEGDFDTSRERLAQAALQLEGRPPASASRRAVHGMRARLALDFVALQRPEEAEALAEVLFEEAEAEPEIGGPATVELATYYARTRASATREAGLEESQLPLFRVALTSAEQDAASAQRLELAYEVSQMATRDGDDDLARRAIELALGDATTVQPSDKAQIASLQVYRARIARAQGDLAAAEEAATVAYQLFDDIDAPASSLAVGESTLAAILAERGDETRARAILDGVRARLAQNEKLPEHAARTILAETARSERALGNAEGARVLFRRALDVPGVEFQPDKDLVEDVRRELAELEERPTDAAGDASEEAAADSGDADVEESGAD